MAWMASARTASALAMISSSSLSSPDIICRLRVCLLWALEFRLLEEFLLGFVELGFRITLEFEGSSSSVQTGSIILLRVASSLNFVGSWIFMEA